VQGRCVRRRGGRKVIVCIEGRDAVGLSPDASGGFHVLFWPCTIAWALRPKRFKLVSS